jgi:glutaconate CoA-transferase subunit B
VAREAAGLPANTGPLAVISTLATLGFDPTTCRMRLDALHPGVTVDQVLENTGFELLMADEIKENLPPTSKELETLREEIDPTGLYI